MTHKVKIYRENESAVIPEYAHPGDSGMDLKCNLELSKENCTFGLGYGCGITPNEEAIYIIAGGTALIATGLRVALPEGYEFQVRSKSGLALKGIQVANSPGTVDEGYRGDIGVILHNQGFNPVQITDGMKIGQLVIAKVERCEFVEVESLSDLDSTSRGEGGFGSTGV